MCVCVLRRERGKGRERREGRERERERERSALCCFVGSIPFSLSLSSPSLFFFLLSPLRFALRSLTHQSLSNRPFHSKGREREREREREKKERRDHRQTPRAFSSLSLLSSLLSALSSLPLSTAAVRRRRRLERENRPYLRIALNLQGEGAAQKRRHRHLHPFVIRAHRHRPSLSLFLFFSLPLSLFSRLSLVRLVCGGPLRPPSGREGGGAAADKRRSAQMALAPSSRSRISCASSHPLLCRVGSEFITRSFYCIALLFHTPCPRSSLAGSP